MNRLPALVIGIIFLALAAVTFLTSCGQGNALERVPPKTQFYYTDKAPSCDCKCNEDLHEAEPQDDYRDDREDR